MRLGSARKFNGALVLCILAFSPLAVALAQDQPKAGWQQAQATQAQPAPGQPIWSVNCVGTSGGLDCRAVEAVRVTDTAQAAVAVHVPPDTKKPVMTILIPLGIYLPAGATLQFGQDAAKTLPFQTCEVSGCLAEYAITGAEITAMLKGEVVTITIQSRNQQPLPLQLPVASFPAAYAKIK